MKAGEQAMPIPYRDADEVEDLGAAGYLKIESSPVGPGYLEIGRAHV